jgi:hypothetical protein
LSGSPYLRRKSVEDDGLEVSCGACDTCLAQLLGGYLGPPETPVWLENAALERPPARSLPGDAETVSRLVSERLPLPWPDDLTVAAKFVFAPDEAQLLHLIEFQLIDDGGRIAGCGSDVLLPLADDGERDTERNLRVALSIRLEGFGFRRPGAHALAIICDGSVLGSLPLEIVPAH